MPELTRTVKMVESVLTPVAINQSIFTSNGIVCFRLTINIGGPVTEGCKVGYHPENQPVITPSVRGLARVDSQLSDPPRGVS